MFFVVIVSLVLKFVIIATKKREITTVIGKQETITQQASKL
jgi:hypothetical protein